MASVVLGGLVTSTIVSLFLLPALHLRFAYGKASVDDLDLRDLWVERVVPPLTAAGVDGNGNGDGHKIPSEVGATTETPEAWPS
jgi:hypothetical protein